MNDVLNLSPFDPAREHRLVLIADSLPPDFGAVGQYMLLRANMLADRGHVVELFGLTSGSSSVEHKALGQGALTVVRMQASSVPRGCLMARLCWTLSVNVRLLAKAFRSLRSADGILFTGSPPYLLHILAPLKVFFPGRLIYRITDFHPECLMASLDRPSGSLRMLQRLTNFWRKRVETFEVLGEDQRGRLVQQGIAIERISLVRDRSPVAVPENIVARPLPPGLQGKYVLLYSGNFGIAHEWKTVAQGYVLHHRSGSGRIHLWLNAVGGAADLLSNRLAGEGVPFVRSLPVPLEELGSLLQSADAHLITLKDAFVGFVMPSKIYATLELKAPVLFVGSSESDIDLLASRAGVAYWRVSCGDAAGFSRALEGLGDHIRNCRDR